MSRKGQSIPTIGDASRSTTSLRIGIPLLSSGVRQEIVREDLFGRYLGIKELVTLCNRLQRQSVRL